MSKDASMMYDISDLLQYWHSNIRPTGIQRVQAEVIRSSIRELSSGDEGAKYIHFCLEDQDWKSVDPHLLLRQIQLSDERVVDETAWHAMRRDMMLNCVDLDFETDCTLINIGSSWWIPDYLYKINQLKTEYRLRYVPFIHDTIPLITPQYCPKELVSDFILWFRDAVRLADHVIVNSESSKRDVHRFAMLSNRACPDISVCTLNARFDRPRSTRRSRVTTELGLHGRRFVLCVGTLEARKNHLMLFKTWVKLLHELPYEEVPFLVLVGKVGWRFEMSQAFVASDPDLEQKVIFARNIADSDLASLYEKCLFTVYPSFYEGWGLPVTEAACYGKLTICSNTSSLPEAASHGDILLDPSDEAGWFEAVKTLVSNPAVCRRAQDIDPDQRTFRAWSDVAKSIFRAGQNASRDGFNAYPTAKVVDGIIYDFSSLTARENYACSAMALRSGSGWHHLEDWGAWSAPGETDLVFDTVDLERRFLYLSIRGGRQEKTLRVAYDHKVVLRRILQANCDIIIRLDLNGSADRRHVLTLSVDKMCDFGALTGGMDRRQVGLGLLRFACMKADDLFSRQNFLESLQMQFAHLVA